MYRRRQHRLKRQSHEVSQHELQRLRQQHLEQERIRSLARLSLMT